jgi:hypothetical protein
VNKGKRKKNILYMNIGKKVKKMNKRKFKAKIMLKRRATKESNIFNLNITIKREKTIEK